jgi:hypothetical protein
MSSHLIAGPASSIAVLVIVLAITPIVKALASVLRTWIEQASRTRRLARSLEGTKPHQRPGIIMACGQLEGRTAGESGSDETGRPAPPSGIEHG